MNKLLLMLVMIISSLKASEFVDDVKLKINTLEKVSLAELVSLNGAHYSFDQVMAFSGDKGNGGDLCENNISSVISDIERWILEDGHLSLVLPTDITTQVYKNKMLEAIYQSRVTCIDKILTVENKEKACVNFADSSETSLIVCNRSLIKEMSIDDKYRLVHHEVAGVAKIESGSRDGTSRYDVSNQIAAYLENEVVTRLSVKEVSRGFTQIEKAKAYKVLSQCSSKEASLRRNHLENAIKLATADKMTLEEAVVTYNKLSCLTNDLTTTRISNNIFTKGRVLSMHDYFLTAVNLHTELDKLTKFSSFILENSFDTIMDAVMITGNVKDPIETYLDIMSTLAWDSSYGYSRYSYEKRGNNKNVTVDGLSVYKLIWEL